MSVKGRTMPHRWTHAELMELARFTTPTVSNALELCTARSPLEGFNREETRDFMPELGPMIGYAVTAEYVATCPARAGENRNLDLLRALEAAPKPAIVVIRDVDSPDGIVGAPWGECFSSTCRALGAVGTITDGAVRDHDEMRRVGFRALARRLCVSHALGHMCAVGRPVEVFGTAVRPGDLIHADQHGFLIVPDDVGPELIEAAAFRDRCEVHHIITPARGAGFSVARFERCAADFAQALAEGRFRRTDAGEWKAQ